jgi:1,4-alpha-glucan branching enzyme
MSPESKTAIAPPQLLTDQDLYLFNEGSNYRLYDKMGAHLVAQKDQAGAVFSVWAPNARSVSVVGSFNSWNPKSHRLEPRASSGIWEGFIAGVTQGALYKFHIESQTGGYIVDKADPVGILQEQPPRTASVVWDLAYEWGDRDWMQKRGERNSLRAPQAIYEVHLGSCRRRTTVRLPTARPRRALPIMCNAWASRTWSSCR